MTSSMSSMPGCASSASVSLRMVPPRTSDCASECSALRPVELSVSVVRRTPSRSRHLTVATWPISITTCRGARPSELGISRSSEMYWAVNFSEEPRSRDTVAVSIRVPRRAA